MADANVEMSEPHDHAWTHDHVYLGAGHARAEARTRFVVYLTAAFMAVEAVWQPGGRSRSAEARAWGLFVLAALVVALLTPLGVAGIVQPIRLMQMPALQAGTLRLNANLGLVLVRNLVTTDLRGEFDIKNRKRGRGTVAHISFEHA